MNLELEPVSFIQQSLKIYLNGVKEVGDHFGRISARIEKFK